MFTFIIFLLAAAMIYPTTWALAYTQHDPADISLPASKIQQFDALVQELGPGSRNDSSLPRYAELIDALTKGTYLTPYNRILPQPRPDSFKQSAFEHYVQLRKKTCEPSNASPHIDYATTLMNVARQTWGGKKCDNDNKFKSNCRELGSYRDASLSICGNVSAWTVKCEKLFPMWDEMLRDCRKKHTSEGYTVVGGKYEFTYVFADGPSGKLYLRVLIH